MRAFKLALLILALVPVAWLREPPPPPPRTFSIARVDLVPALRSSLPRTGELTVAGAWQFVSNTRRLGTLSGLAHTGSDFVAVGDRGGILRFSRPDRPGPWHARLDRLVPFDVRKYPFPIDAESVFVEPATGKLVVGYEDAPMLERFNADLSRGDKITLPVLSEWPENQGPEAMARLADGRTVIIGETYSGWFDQTRHPCFIFPGKLRAFEAPARAEFVLPTGYRPSEMAQMPDGRVLVLGRYLSFEGFRSIILILAPQDIHPGALITPRVIARIDDPRIRDNFEGMTVTREADGSQTIWLISDSNEMVWAQRTLLLKLRVGPEVR